jgi:tetratricopeptide (TPR) repeat protein
MTSRDLQAALELHRAGRWGEAETLCHRILEIEAGDPDALLLLHQIGIALKSLGRLDEAVRIFRTILDAQPGFTDACNNLGNALQGLGRLQEAEASYRKALALDPDHVAVHVNLGVALQRLGRFPEAEEHIRRALAVKADSAETHNQLGNLLQQLGRYSEAELVLREALQLKSDYAEAHNNLGIVLGQLGRLDEAEQCFRLTLAFNSGAAEAHGNLGLVLERLGRYVEAEQSCRQAVALSPGAFGAHGNLGIVLRRLGRPAEAEECFRKALALNPGYTDAQANWIHLCQVLCIWSEELEQAIVNLRWKIVRQEAPSTSPFSLLAMPSSEATEHYLLANHYAIREFCEALARPPMHVADRRTVRHKLRVGFLSGDFHEHATSYLLAEVVERHDRSRCELVGYSFGPNDDAARCVRADLRAAFEHISRHQEPGSRDVGAPDRCRRYRYFWSILKGYTDQGRTQIMALRPAPVQATGSATGTLGHSRLADYH